MIGLELCSIRIFINKDLGAIILVRNDDKLIKKDLCKSIRRVLRYEIYFIK